MSGTKEGSKKAAQTMYDKYGREYFVRMGARGGKNRSPLKGFGGMTPEKRIEAGRKGGTISRRGPAKAKEA